jgi:putative hemolysin
MALVFWIILLVLLLLVCAFFAGIETALFSLSSAKVKTFKQENNPKKQAVSKLLSRPGDLLVSLIILNVLASVCIQNLISHLFGAFSHWTLSVGLPLILILVFGEVIPKSISFANNERFSLAAGPFLLKIQAVLSIFRKAIMLFVHFLSYFLSLIFRKEKDVSLNELKHALKTSHQSGILNTEEAELMEGYLHLRSCLVKDFYRPRSEVLYFNVDDSLSQLVHLFVDQECSRIPVCEGGLDKILGIISSRVYFLYRKNFHQSRDILPYLKKPFFVPESMDADGLLKQMYEKKESLALVVDEYGAVSGLIALEDLIEVVVGEIVDRRDEKSLFTHFGKDVLIASGKLELAELQEIFGIRLESPNHMVTIGGWLTEQLGDIPKAGSKLIKNQMLFHVLSADVRRVRRVYIRKLSLKDAKS